MSSITIPDTPDFQDKALKVATTYNRWALMDFVSKLQEGKDKTEDFSLNAFLNELNEGELGYLELNGYSAEKLKDENIYGKQGPIGYQHHKITVKKATDDFLAARNELYKAALEANPQVTSQRGGYTKIFTPGDTAKDKLEEELSQKVSMIALDKGFHLPDRMNYFFAAPTISLN